MSNVVENIRIHLSRMQIAKSLMRKKSGMGYAECVALWILHEAEKPLTGRDMRNHWLGGQLVSTLTTLEKKGLLVRVLGDNVQKAKLNSLSHEGEELSNELFNTGEANDTPTLIFLISLLKENREKLEELDKLCRKVYSPGGARACNVATALNEKSPLTLKQIAKVTSIDYAMISSMTGNVYVRCVNPEAAEGNRLYELTDEGRKVLHKLSTA